MKKLISSIISLILCISAASSQELLLKADTAYTKADYGVALELYNQVLDSLGTSAELYYNIGNAYYRTGNVAQSILAYERALRLDPTLSEARANLDFVNSRLTDRPGDMYSFLELAQRNINNTFSSNTWVWLGLILLALFIGSALLYYFSSNILLRKSGFFGGLAILALSVFCICEAFYGKRLARADNEAIITAKSTILSTSPRTPLNSSEEAMMLHEGTKVYIQDSVSVDSDSTKVVWYDVKVDDEHRAWISKSAIEKI